MVHWQPGDTGDADDAAPRGIRLASRRRLRTPPGIQRASWARPPTMNALWAGWLRARPVREPVAAGLPVELQIRDEYLPLYSYLEHRYALSVVLTFEQIESLLGFALPPAARQDSGWWTNVASNDAAWTAAKRTA